ncbi:long-chain-fatty-acid--CoA ligase [Rudaeicoccus suwonensis]|uniref:Acyl-CoA synthetase (AMP-forming)/AMP-acid ligase II n=1 Tax=Rudaeicoccus suwonensis TaxID=657409 RepID=A0A561DX36_9MICO|nr:long-chain-fatty-acid--CoA ligase [Rudaeicoccus suwonensis]TWE07892.1 acyl-CoA synthetase (AMP-forming)/AMP-acid ligase II [Rudaeicoccus suwonensis]
MSLAQILRDAIARDRSAVALDGDSRTVTFGELDATSNRVANALIAAGVGRGDRVVFIDRNSTAFWEVYLGCLKAGAVMVPLNFRLSAAEVAWAVQDCEPTVIVVDATFADLVPADFPTVVVIADAPAPDPRESGRPRYDAWLEDAADTDPGRDATGGEYVGLLYSSGTTGRPKGVLVSDEQQEWAVPAFASYFDVDSDSRSLVPIPYFHIAGGGWAMVTLSRGGTVIQSREPTAESMFDQLVRHRATHTAMVPAVMRILTQSPEARAADFSALRQLVYGGSPISEALVRASSETFGTQLFQSYGLSETTGVTTLLGPEQHRPDGDLSRLRSAGRAVDGIDLQIRDPFDGSLLPAGASGEIVVRGPSVTPGYWRLPEATKQAFTADGFLRTGDVGTLDEDGFLYIRDRIKDLIVSGGENIYPAEVESVLADHPQVADIAVVGIPDERWGERPIAFAVASGGELDPADVVAFARERMAHFKCPTEVVVLPELPRNASGKILKRDLREPYWLGHDRAVR